MRLLFYPVLSRGEFSHLSRIAAPAEFGTFMLHFQDNVDGLQEKLPAESSKFYMLRDEDCKSAFSLFEIICRSGWECITHDIEFTCLSSHERIRRSWQKISLVSAFLLRILQSFTGGHPVPVAGCYRSEDDAVMVCGRG